jgi:lysozyme
MRRGVRTLAFGSSALIAVLAAFEGFRQFAYLDSVGIPTIGFGHTEGVRMGNAITRRDAEALLMEDAERHQREIAACIRVPLHEHEWTAYSSLAFNIGAGAFCGSTLARRLNRGDYAGACAEILRWVRAKGRVLAGLVTRRKAEYRICIGERS